MDIKKYLQDDVLNFWLKNSIDNVNGGIYTNIDQKGNIYGREKSVWFQGRALWTFSKAYNVIEKKPEYLEAATTIYSFLKKCTDCDDRMYFTVTEDGKELQKRRYWYSETFAAIGCAEFYKATGKKEVLKDAQYYFDTAIKLFKNPSLSAPKLNPKNAPFKAIAPVMIMLNTAQIMSSVDTIGNNYREIVTECMEEILHGGYIKKEMGAVLENVTLDGNFHDSPQTRVVNPGHSLECAWFLMSAGKVFGNDEAVKTGKDIIDFTLEKGIDEKNGGIIAFRDVNGCPPVQLEWDMKLWWPQCEAIIATGLAYSIFGEEKYRTYYENFKKYAFDNFADIENGEWYGYLHYDNTPSTTLKGNIFKGPFHLPRMLMIIYFLEKDGNIETFIK